VKADCGSYFVAMYIQTEITCKKKRKETREYQKREKINYLIALSNAKVLLLNSRKRIK